MSRTTFIVVMYIVGQRVLDIEYMGYTNLYHFSMVHGNTSLWISLLIFHLPKVLMPFLLLWMSALRWHFLPCTKTIISEEIAYNVKREVFQHHGLLDSIIIDRGPQFVSKFWKHLFKMLKVTCDLSSGYHPQTDGLTERTNQMLEHYLRCFLSYQ